MSELTMNGLGIAPDKVGECMEAKIKVSEIQKQLRELQAKPKKKNLLVVLRWLDYISNLRWRRPKLGRVVYLKPRHISKIFV